MATATLLYTCPRSDQPLVNQTAKLEVSPDLAAEPAASQLVQLDCTVFSDTVTNDGTHMFRIIVLTLGADFLARYTTTDAKKAKLMGYFTATIELLMPVTCTAAVPVIA